MHGISRLGLCVMSTAAAAVAMSGAASADPWHAPNLTVGTADCGSAGTFSFIVTGSNGTGTPYNVAFATSTTNGQRAVFHPSSVDAIVTTPNGSFPEQTSKPSGPGPISCAITGSPAPGVTITGTVTGWITWRGRG